MDVQDMLDLDDIQGVRDVSTIKRNGLQFKKSLGVEDLHAHLRYAALYWNDVSLPVALGLAIEQLFAHHHHYHKHAFQSLSSQQRKESFEQLHKALYCGSIRHACEWDKLVSETLVRAWCNIMQIPQPVSRRALQAYYNWGTEYHKWLIHSLVQYQKYGRAWIMGLGPDMGGSYPQNT